MWLALYAIFGLFVAAVVVLGLILITHVEDWSRDLSTNVAVTSDDAKDIRLRTLETGLPPAELAHLVGAVAKTLPRWELVEESTDQSAAELHFVRTTGIMQYRDDIRVRIEPASGGSRLSAESRSRVGRGDLGQNPRNLGELLRGVREKLSDRGTTGGAAR